MMRLSKRGKALARVESPRLLLMAVLKNKREMPTTANTQTTKSTE